jgi:hypothetical protein
MQHGHETRASHFALVALFTFQMKVIEDIRLGTEISSHGTDGTPLFSRMTIQIWSRGTPQAKSYFYRSG